MTLTTTTTADEFLALGETDEHMELIEGEIVIMSIPRKRHQAITLHIVVQLTLWCEAAAGRGTASIELDHRLDGRNVFAPDALWVCDERWPAEDVSHLVGPPDIAVEVRSESTWRYDVGKKMTVYERNGLPELWLVDTAANSVLVYRRSTATTDEFDIALELRGGDVLSSPQLPDFELDIARLFDR